MAKPALHFAKRAILVGSGPLADQLLSHMALPKNRDYQIIGVVPLQLEAISNHHFPVIGEIAELHQVVERERPELIITVNEHDKRGLIDRQLLEAALLHDIKIEHAEDVYERITGKLPIESYRAEDVLYSTDFQPSRITRFAARVYSVVAAAIAAVLLSPVILITAILIKLDDKGPVLFVQERLGFAGKRFKLLKFRTMVPAADIDSQWEKDNRKRITRIGRWLRRYRLDELPQFLNVIKGDMNLVGPRPHPASNFALFVLASRNAASSAAEIPYYSMRSRVLPGITGWAQVRYSYANNLEEELEKLRFDLYYIKHYSLWLDLRILAETVVIVLSGSGYTSREQIRPRPGAKGDLASQVGGRARQGIDAEVGESDERYSPRSNVENNARANQRA